MNTTEKNGDVTCIEIVSDRAKKASITNGDIYETERKQSQLRNKTKVTRARGLS